MAGLHHPHPLPFVRFPPAQIAAGPHQTPKNPGKVSGVQADQPHSFEHALLQAVDYLVLDLIVSQMSPPDQHVGNVEQFVGEAMLRLVERGGAGLHVRQRFQKPRDGLVDTVRIVRLDLGIGKLVSKLVPNRDSYRSRHLSDLH